VTDMTLQQVSLSGVIICPDQELEQRFAVNSFTVASFLHYRRHGTQAWRKRPLPLSRRCHIRKGSVEIGSDLGPISRPKSSLEFP
jgi:hypothetical protein